VRNPDLWSEQTPDTDRSRDTKFAPNPSGWMGTVIGDTDPHASHPAKKRKVAGQPPTPQEDPLPPPPVDDLSDVPALIAENSDFFALLAAMIAELTSTCHLPMAYAAFCVDFLFQAVFQTPFSVWSPGDPRSPWQHNHAFALGLVRLFTNVARWRMPGDVQADIHENSFVNGQLNMEVREFVRSLLLSRRYALAILRKRQCYRDPALGCIGDENPWALADVPKVEVFAHPDVAPEAPPGCRNPEYPPPEEFLTACQKEGTAVADVGPLYSLFQYDIDLFARAPVHGLALYVGHVRGLKTYTPAWAFVNAHGKVQFRFRRCALPADHSFEQTKLESNRGSLVPLERLALRPPFDAITDRTQLGKAVIWSLREAVGMYYARRTGDPTRIWPADPALEDEGEEKEESGDLLRMLYRRRLPTATLVPPSSRDLWCTPHPITTSPAAGASSGTR